MKRRLLIFTAKITAIQTMETVNSMSWLKIWKVVNKRRNWIRKTNLLSKLSKLSWKMMPYRGLFNKRRK